MEIFYTKFLRFSSRKVGSRVNNNNKNVFGEINDREIE